MRTLKQPAHESIYQLKVTLKGSRPTIWRRIQVPENISLYQLHLVLQAVMGWDNYHLYRFRIGGLDFGEPEPEKDLLFRQQMKNAKRTTLNKAVTVEKAKFIYEYDFGDSWEHEILVEKIIAAEPGVHYPVCIKGERACPPEDCGGMWGYVDLLNIINDPSHEQHKERLEWLGRKFDPEAFNIDAINKLLSLIR